MKTTEHIIERRAGSLKAEKYGIQCRQVSAHSDDTDDYVGEIEEGKRGYFIVVRATNGDDEVYHRIPQKKVQELEKKTGLSGQALADLIAKKTTAIHFSNNGRYGTSSISYDLRSDEQKKADEEAHAAIEADRAKKEAEKMEIAKEFLAKNNVKLKVSAQTREVKTDNGTPILDTCVFVEVEGKKYAVHNYRGYYELPDFWDFVQDFSENSYVRKALYNLLKILSNEIKQVKIEDMEFDCVPEVMSHEDTLEFFRKNIEPKIKKA